MGLLCLFTTFNINIIEIKIYMICKSKINRKLADLSYIMFTVKAATRVRVIGIKQIGGYHETSRYYN